MHILINVRCKETLFESNIMMKKVEQQTVNVEYSELTNATSNTLQTHKVVMAL